MEFTTEMRLREVWTTLCRYRHMRLPIKDSTLLGPICDALFDGETMVITCDGMEYTVEITDTPTIAR